MRGFRDRADVADVVALLANRLTPLGSEVVALPEAARRVLAKDVVASVAVPSFERAAMDGYALQGQETFGASPYNPLELEVVGEALPGKPFAGQVKPRQAVRIMTGAPMPQTADAVLQAEAAQESNGRLSVTESVPPGRNIGHYGEDIAAGAVVLQAG